LDRDPHAAEPHESARSLAFFVDVEGTILELSSRPDAIQADTDAVDLLRTLIRVSDGAVALISGRSIAILDELFQPLQLPSAGLHGFERRNAAGEYFRRPLPNGSALDRARGQLRRLVARYPGVLLEDKRFALAVHYREFPSIGPLLRKEMDTIARPLSETLEIRSSGCVIELRPKGTNSAVAIADFMQEPSFLGRWPVCLGGECTDEQAFDWINAAGGYSVAVGLGRASAARAHIASIPEARAWLQRLASSPFALPQPIGIIGSGSA
jgi:trehalose 6-phosphate phosphatase